MNCQCQDGGQEKGQENSVPHHPFVEQNAAPHGPGAKLHNTGSNTNPPPYWQWSVKGMDLLTSKFQQPQKQQLRHCKPKVYRLKWLKHTHHVATCYPKIRIQECHNSLVHPTHSVRRKTKSNQPVHQVSQTWHDRHRAIIDQNTRKCNGYYFPFSKVILPVIKTVPHTTQYGTVVTVPDIQNTILLAESLLWTQLTFNSPQDLFLKQTKPSVTNKLHQHGLHPEAETKGCKTGRNGWKLPQHYDISVLLKRSIFTHL